MKLQDLKAKKMSKQMDIQTDASSEQRGFSYRSSLCARPGYTNNGLWSC